VEVKLGSAEIEIWLTLHFKQCTWLREVDNFVEVV